MPDLVIESPFRPISGNSNKFDNAITDFAEMYADKNEHDHGALGNAVAKGKVQAETGV